MRFEPELCITAVGRVITCLVAVSQPIWYTICERMVYEYVVLREVWRENVVNKVYSLSAMPFCVLMRKSKVTEPVAVQALLIKCPHVAAPNVEGISREGGGGGEKVRSGTKAKVFGPMRSKVDARRGRTTVQPLLDGRWETGKYLQGSVGMGAGERPNCAGGDYTSRERRQDGRQVGKFGCNKCNRPRQTSHDSGTYRCKFGRCWTKTSCCVHFYMSVLWSGIRRSVARGQTTQVLLQGTHDACRDGQTDAGEVSAVRTGIYSKGLVQQGHEAIQVLQRQLRQCCQTHNSRIQVCILRPSYLWKKASGKGSSIRILLQGTFLPSASIYDVIGGLIARNTSCKCHLEYGSAE